MTQDWSIPFQPRKAGELAVLSYPHLPGDLADCQAIRKPKAFDAMSKAFAERTTRTDKFRGHVFGKISAGSGNSAAHGGEVHPAVPADPPGSPRAACAHCGSLLFFFLCQERITHQIPSPARIITTAATPMRMAWLCRKWPLRRPR